MILDEIITTNYYSLICDATPDVFKEEITTRWSIKERFKVFWKTELETADEVIAEVNLTIMTAKI